MFYYTFQDLYMLVREYNKKHKDKQININELLNIKFDDYARSEKTDYLRISKDYPPKVLYEDDKYYGIYKPPYWIVNVGNPDLSTFDVHTNKDRNFLQVWLHNNLKYALNDDPVKQYGICNRLDLNTSGIVLVAKTGHDFTYLREVINDHVHTEKRYFCLVTDKIETNGKINVKLDCEKKGLSSQCFNTDYGKYALTYFYVVTYLKDKKGKIYTLLDIQIKTGRTHQIRIHMKMLNTYIIGDNMYTKSIETYKYDRELVPRIFLHAYNYNFKKESGEVVKVHCPLAADLLKAVKDNFEVDDSEPELTKDDVINILEHPETLHQ